MLTAACGIHILFGMILLQRVQGTLTSGGESAVNVSIVTSVIFNVTRTKDLLAMTTSHQTGISRYSAISTASNPSSSLAQLITSSLIQQLNSSQANKLTRRATNQEDIIAISILLGICAMTVLAPISVIIYNLLCHKKRK